MEHQLDLVVGTLTINELFFTLVAEDEAVGVFLFLAVVDPFLPGSKHALVHCAVQVHFVSYKLATIELSLSSEPFSCPCLTSFSIFGRSERRQNLNH